MGDLQLLIEMGFPENRVKKAMKATKNAGVQPALDWLEQHQNDPDIDNPDTETQGNQLSGAKSEDTDETAADATANSLKCDDCSKLLKSTDAAQLHAGRTGHTNFSQSTEVVKPLSEEEKKQKLEELKAKLAAKRAEQAEIEKNEAKERERLRRITGRDISKAKEEQKDKEILKALEEKKREKQEELAAKKRIKEQIEADKRARAEKAAEEKRIREGKMLQQAPSPVAKPPETKGDFKETRIQVRVTGQPPITKTFDANGKFKELVQHLQSLGLNGSLMMTYPRKSFSSSDEQKTFAELNLCPSAALILQ